MDKEHDSITTCIGLTTGGVHIFIGHVSMLDKEVARFVEKDLLNFILDDMMLDFQFFQNVTQPEKTVNVHPRRSSQWSL
ncbi:MAG: hypothetical protein M5U11_05295 [Anaerolineales bacterium]|nr:hypothetical protein [Anaerolineales bacterium]MDX9937145.1 hypothetical protein [Anaerolineales bacterium]